MIGGDSLSRFFTLHVFVIPGALLAFLGVHLWLVLKRGISEPPVPGRPVDPETYDAEYEEELKHGVPFLGEAMLKDVFFSAMTVIVVVALAAMIGPKGPTGRPTRRWRGEPAAGVAVPLAVRPALAQPGRGGDVHHPGFPGHPDRGLVPRPVRQQPGRTRTEPPAGRRAGGHRDLHGAWRSDLPGCHRAWSPKMTAWSGDPIPHAWCVESTPLQLQGAVMLQNKNCRNCHALEGIGGQRGPDLTTVGTRLTRDQLIDQISNGTPGGGNMPAYGKQLNPAEMTALVEFLVSLRPSGQPPGRRRPRALR